MRGWDGHSVIWTAGVLSASGAFLCLVTLPQIQRLTEATALLEASEVELSGGLSSDQIAPHLQRELDQLAAQAARFEQQIPAQEALGMFLEAVARSAEEHKLRADTIEPGQPLRSQQVASLPIRLKVRGAFPELHAFIRDVEQLPRLTQIERFKVTLDPEQPGVVAADVELRIFCRAL